MNKAIKTLYYVAICLAASTTMWSCSDNDDPTPPPVNPPALTTEWDSEAYYKGDYYDNSTGNLWVGLISTSLTYSEDDEDYVGNGKIILIDFNTALAENPDFATLKPGDYVCADTHAEGTINLDDESYVTVYTENASPEMLSVTDGYINVSLTDGIYTIEGTLTTSDGTETEVKYVGPLAIYNRSDEGHKSNITGNITLSALTQGLALYGGEVFTSTSDYYMLIISEADYDVESNFGPGQAINLGLNVTPGSNTGIPSGTYTLIDPMEADDYDPFTALGGFYEATYGGFYGAWYFYSLKGLEASAATGTVTVDNKGNNQYTITLNLKDGYGHAITGTYTGALQLEDVS